MAKLKYDLTATDRASAVIRKVSTAAKTAAMEMIKNDKDLSKSTMEASKAKQTQLTLSQRTKFAVEKEAAAGNKLKTNLVQRKEQLAKSERALKQAIKSGDENAQALAKQTAELKKNVKKLDEQSKAQDKSAMSAKGLAKAAAVASAAIAGMAAASFLLTKRFATQNDEMIKTSQRLNLNVEDYQKLDFAMKISGTSIEQQKGALTRFARTARDASAGVKIAEDAFNTLGVSVKNDAGEFKGMHELLLESADQFKAMPPSVEKTAISMDLFGRSGAALTQFLNLGSAGMREMGVEAESLGGVISEKAAKSSEEFIDALTRMELAATGVGKSMGAEFEPMYTRAMNQVAISMGRLKKVYTPFFKNWIKSGKEWGEVLIPIGIAVGKTFVLVGEMVLKSWEGLKLIVNGILGGLVGSLNAIRGVENSIRKALGMELLEMHFNSFVLVAQDNVDQINNITAATIATFEELDKLGNAVMGKGEKRKSQINQLIDREKALTKTIADRKEAEKKGDTVKDPALVSLTAIDATIDKQKEWADQFPQLWDMSTKQRNQFIKDTEQQGIAAARLGAQIGDKIGTAIGFLADESLEWGDKMKNVYQLIISTGRDAAISAITSYAASAAGAAYFSQAGIPVIGPALAVGAAGTAFALVSAFADRMHDGGIVPGAGNQEVPAILQAGELVLPRKLTSEILSVAGRPGAAQASNGGGITINMNESGNFMPRTPAELDRFVRDRLVPALNRLKHQGAYS